MTETVQIITAEKVPELIERILALRNPELAATRSMDRKRALDRARNWTGTTVKIGPEGLGSEFIVEAMLGARKPAPVPRGSYIITDRSTNLVIGGDRVTDLNRDLNVKRVEKYLNAMLNNEWILTPDAIAVTANGLVINGQHRLEAARRYAERIDHLVNKELKAHSEELKADPERESVFRKDLSAAMPWPRFIIAWNMDPGAAILMDEAYRSPADRRAIARRYTTLDHPEPPATKGLSQ